MLSDLHLDNPRVMTALQEVLSAYDAMEDERSVPKLFVLCGNFRSRPWLFNGEAMREYTGAPCIPAGSRPFLQFRLTCSERAPPPELFASLASLLATFETLLATSHFLLIPGPTDPWSSAALPRPPLPTALLKPLLSKIPNVTLGSNPCRVRWFSQEIVIFRDDLMGRMMRNAVRFPAEEGGGAGGRKGDLRKAVESQFARL